MGHGIDKTQSRQVGLEGTELMGKLIGILTLEQTLDFPAVIRAEHFQLGTVIKVIYCTVLVKQVPVGFIHHCLGIHQGAVKVKQHKRLPVHLLAAVEHVENQSTSGCDKSRQQHHQACIGTAIGCNVDKEAAQANPQQCQGCPVPSVFVIEVVAVKHLQQNVAQHVNTDDKNIAPVGEHIGYAGNGRG